jgi:hypothetical protein
MLSLMDEIAKIILNKAFPPLYKSGSLTWHREVASEILALPSDFEGMTIQDVLEKFNTLKLIANEYGKAESCDNCSISYLCAGDGYCEALASLLWHNGQPIRRRDEADTL